MIDFFPDSTAPWVWLVLYGVGAGWLILLLKIFTNHMRRLPTPDTQHPEARGLSSSSNIFALADINTLEAIDKLRKLIEEMEDGTLKVKYGVVALKINDRVAVVDIGYAAPSERMGLLMYSILDTQEDR